MAGLTFKDLCSIFCCPPCLGSVASKLAFLPPAPSYTIVPERAPREAATSEESGFLRGGAVDQGSWKLQLSDRARFRYHQPELETIEVFMTKSRRGHQIACMHVRCDPEAKYTILFSHGNAIDLGRMVNVYIGLGTKLKCNIFSYDYSGYGASTGRASEKHVYADIDAAWQALTTRYGVAPENIILYGQSIGSVPTIDLASRCRCAAVVLHAAFTSGGRIIFPEKTSSYCDSFRNIDKVAKIASPVLVIHGTDDDIIDIAHGISLYERCQKTLEPLWLEGAGHNNIEAYSQYIDRLLRLTTHDLPA